MGPLERQTGAGVSSQFNDCIGAKMKQFTFRLDPLVRLKRQSQRLAELQVLEKQSRVDQARQQIADLQRQLSASAEVIQRQASARGQPCRCLAECVFASHIRDCLYEAQRELLEAEHKLREAATKHRNVSVELEVLRSLRRSQWTGHVKSVQRDRDDKLDWLVLRQWQQSTMDGPEDEIP